MPTNRTATGKWKSTRRALITAAKRRGELHCAVCGRDLDPEAPRCTPNAIEVDHIIPVVDRPDLEYERSNLRLLDYECNRRKSCKSADEYDMQRRGATTAMPTFLRSGHLSVGCDVDGRHQCTPLTCADQWSWWIEQHTDGATTS